MSDHFDMQRHERSEIAAYVEAFPELAVRRENVPSVADFIVAFQVCIAELTERIRTKIIEADLKPNDAHNHVLDLLIAFVSGKDKRIDYDEQSVLYLKSRFERIIHAHAERERVRAGKHRRGYGVPKNARDLKNYLFGDEVHSANRLEAVAQLIKTNRRLANGSELGGVEYECLLVTHRTMQKPEYDGRYSLTYQGRMVDLGDIRISEQWLFMHLSESKRPRFLDRQFQPARTLAA